LFHRFKPVMQRNGEQRGEAAISRVEERSAKHRAEKQNSALSILLQIIDGRNRASALLQLGRNWNDSKYIEQKSFKDNLAAQR
jgi:hypothetical protein